MYQVPVILLALCAVYAQPTTEPKAPHYVSCEFKHNGLLEIGCWGYVFCKDGVPHTTLCPNGLVYDRDNNKCTAPNPSSKYLRCDDKATCTGKTDQRYSDLVDGCESYYVCSDEAFAGRFFCPAGTVFNELLQTCDWPGDTKPPCGTYKYTRTTYGPGPI